MVGNMQKRTYLQAMLNYVIMLCVVLIFIFLSFDNSESGKSVYTSLESLLSLIPPELV